MNNHRQTTAAGLLICLLFTAIPARAEESMSFVAQVDDENLAEEAILLAHCLATHSGRSWEFNGETRGSHWLRVQEKEHRLHGTYRNGAKEIPFNLSAGDADQTCETLEPSLDTSTAKDPKDSLAPVSPLALGKSDGESVAVDNPRSKTWIWAGLGLAAVAGFFIYKSHQPNHTAVQMN